MREYRGAIIPSREQRVVEACDPGPFGRRPHDLVAPWPVAQRLLHRRDAAQHHAMSMQRALGLARRAGGVDQQRRILGRGVDRGEAVGGGGQQAIPIEEGAAVRAGADHDDGPEVWQAITHRQDLGQVGHIGDDGGGLGIGEPEFDRFLAEQREERQHDRAHAVAGEMAEREFRALAQENGHAVALRDPTRAERVGEPRAGDEQLAEGPVADAAIGIFDDHRQRVGRMAFADRATDVEPLRPWPAELLHGVVVGETAGDHTGWNLISAV